jgi:DeoR/GlpR family transcriptional regulator of sugar metabolism
VTTLAPPFAEVGLAERRRLIADIVRARAYVTVRDLSVEFAVTPTTIRTDLDALAGLGVLTRVHGGAVRLAPGGG